MASYQIVAWKGIPASVEARDAQETVTVALSERFQMLIDSVAMQLGGGPFNGPVDEASAPIIERVRQHRRRFNPLEPMIRER